jgi:hypothetical protein
MKPVLKNERIENFIVKGHHCTCGGNVLYKPDDKDTSCKQDYRGEESK